MATEGQRRAMMFGEVPLANAEGALLAHSLMLGGHRVPKGSPVDRALVEAAAAAGLDRLWVARAEPGDIAEADAAARIGAALAGAGVAARAPVHGRVNLHAACDGLLRIDTDAVARANAAGEAIGIATLPPDTPVRAGTLLATVKIIPFNVPADLLSPLLAGPPALQVRPWQAIGPVHLVHTLLPDTPHKQLAKTASVLRARVARFGWALVESDPVAHGVAPLASAIAVAGASGALILVAGAAATADRRDVVPAAIAAAGGVVLRVGMPVDPGNLLVLGALHNGAVVIGLPGCARSPRRNGLDLVLERLAADRGITAGAIAAMGVGGLLEESGVPVPWAWRP